MFEVLAHSGDPAQLSGLLHPNGYPGYTYARIFERLFILYSVPFAVSFCTGLLACFLRRQKPGFSLSLPLIALVPGAFWVVLAYADPSLKGTGNLLELSVLGFVAGLVCGFGGRLVRPAINGITTAWALTVLAALLFLYVPGWPSRSPWAAALSLSSQFGAVANVS